MKQAGAKAILLCANTMHLIADELEQRAGLPVIHIAAGSAIRQQKLAKTGPLGTRFTMELDFFKAKLAEQHIETAIPGDDDRQFVHYTIFEELGRGLMKEDTKQRYLRIIQETVNRGAQGIILGCTEIPLLIKPEDVAVPILDTARIHAAAAVEFALY